MKERFDVSGVGKDGTEEAGHGKEEDDVKDDEEKDSEMEELSREEELIETEDVDKDKVSTHKDGGNRKNRKVDDD